MELGSTEVLASSPGGPGPAGLAADEFLDLLIYVQASKSDQWSWLICFGGVLGFGGLIAMQLPNGTTGWRGRAGLADVQRTRWHEGCVRVEAGGADWGLPAAALSESYSLSALVPCTAAQHLQAGNTIDQSSSSVDTCLWRLGCTPVKATWPSLPPSTCSCHAGYLQIETKAAVSNDLEGGGGWEAVLEKTPSCSVVP